MGEPAGPAWLAAGGAETADPTHSTPQRDMVNSLWGTTISKGLAIQVEGPECDAQLSCKAQNTVVCAGVLQAAKIPEYASPRSLRGTRSKDTHSKPWATGFLDMQHSVGWCQSSQLGSEPRARSMGQVLP